ncbi:MAG: hypothetical protein HRT88_15950 [Lentisphaeraceae bacterium]|nr:hypothetical protein [Lentisphaeraceae bacterium]
MNIEYSKRMIPLGVATISKKNLSRINNIWTQGSFEQEGKEQALLWGIQRDNGRGAGFTGGHVHANWAIDGYRQLILNTIAWVAGMDIPKGGVPTFKVTEDELNENLDDYGNKTKRVKIPAAAAERFKNFRPGPWRAPRGRKPKKK